MRNNHSTVLNIQQISQLLPHRYPFLLLDEVIALTPGDYGVGIKNVTANEPYFQGHFPQELVMPGVLIVEACAQLAGVVLMSAQKAAGVAHGIEYLASILKFNFKEKVVPGNQLVLECKDFRQIQSLLQVSVQARVKTKIVAEGQLVITRQQN